MYIHDGLALHAKHSWCLVAKKVKKKKEREKQNEREKAVGKKGAKRPK
jgi:hypothetical protein